jgi:hypothetical protein
VQAAADDVTLVNSAQDRLCWPDAGELDPGLDRLTASVFPARGTGTARPRV